MKTALTLLLGAIGLLLTALGLFGKGWDAGKGVSIRRINKHGWASITLLVFAFMVGIAKQRVDDTQDAKAEHDRAALSSALKDTQIQLQLANERLKDQSRVLAVTEERLVDSKLSLEDLRKSLISARNEASEQGAANLLTVLANTNQTVRDIYLRIPLTARAKVANTFRTALLPNFELASCRDVTGLAVGISTQLSHFEILPYYPGDSSVKHNYFEDEFPKIDELRHFADDPESNEELNAWKDMAHQTTSNRMIYQVRIHPLNHLLSAAQLFSSIMKPGSEAVIVSTSWPSFFNTREFLNGADSVSRWIEKYPQLYNASSIFFNNLGVRPEMKPRPAYPMSCSVQVEQYFRAAFNKAVLVIVLNQQNETIILRLRAKPPQFSKQEWTLAFAVENAPIFSAVQESDLQESFGEWPRAVSHPAAK